MDYLGGCHCGNIHVRLRLTRPPEDNPIRGCTCSFCRSHNPRLVSDPEDYSNFGRTTGRWLNATDLAPGRAISSSVVVAASSSPQSPR